MKIRQLLWMGTLALAVSACKPAETKSDTPADSTATPVVDPVPPADLPPSAALETLTGTYVTTEVGDYVHAIIKGDDKQEYSFYLADDFPEARSAEMTEGLWDGKAVKAQWRKVTRNIPEAGGDIEIDELVSIEAI